MKKHRMPAIIVASALSAISMAASASATTAQQPMTVDHGSSRKADETHPYMEQALQAIRSAPPSTKNMAATVPGRAAAASPGFVDVPSTHPFVDQIGWMKQQEISTGYADGTYRPSDPVLRDQMAAFLFRLVGEPPYYPEACPFIDVPKDRPFWLEMCWLSNRKVSTGWVDPVTGERTYHPDYAIQRDAMAAFVNRYATMARIDPLALKGESIGIWIETIVNVHRTRQGLSKMNSEEPLWKYALAWSRTMATSGSFQHDSVKLAELGYAENIAYQQGTGGAFELAYKFYESWYGSAGHKANIFNATYTKTGAGAARGPDGWYATQDFAQ